MCCPYAFKWNESLSAKSLSLGMSRLYILRNGQCLEAFHGPVWLYEVGTKPQTSRNAEARTDSRSSTPVA